MKDLYKKILEKPESYRRRLVFVLTGIAGVVIFSVWLGMTYSSMQEIIGPSEEEREENPAPQKGKVPSLEDRSPSGIEGGEQTDVNSYNNIYQESQGEIRKPEAENDYYETKEEGVEEEIEKGENH